MKRGALIILSVFLIVVLLSFAGCGSKKSTTVKPKPSNGTANASASAGTSGSVPAAKGPMTKVDLIVADAYFTPTFVSPLEDTELKFIVKNQGTETSGAFDYQVKVYQDGSLWKTEKFTDDSALQRGNTTKIIRTYSFPSNGNYYAEVYVDPDNKINELVETNNFMKTKADVNVFDKVAANTPKPKPVSNDTEE